MYQRIAHISLVVKNYDEAINWYQQKLGFHLIEDTDLGEGKRWVTMAPPGAKECSLLLAEASSSEQEAAVGNQTGGRVFLFLFTDDFDRDYNRYHRDGVEFVRPPQQMPYGKVAVLKDLYGNQWDLLQPNEHNRGVLTAQE
ncbi:MAG TPA: hypothetical protein DCE41_29905 [Cytophagales bacterium]|nr:hypothetical protein [Cytophagales bacterium]HAA20893.1 hypothetical protein [Cytophagales bacterium]